MGGNLLESVFNLPAKRVPRVEFDRIIIEVVRRLQSKFPNRRIEPLKFFSDKQDFGDLDCAFEVFSGENINWRDVIRELFGWSPHINGNCVSFPFEGFQVDILRFSEEVYDIAQVYYAYEAGNFMGRIADKMGLSYGHRGLYLQVPLCYFDARLPDHQYKEILISRNPSDIFDYLGFNLNRFRAGFKNFEEMSQWVADSAYFSPEVFAFDSLNHINRTRNRKRPVYAKFVEWCEKQPKRHIMPSKEEMLKRVIGENPHVQEAMARVKVELILNAERRAKFNGNLVQELRGLEGEALGKFIVAFKKKFDSFEEWLDAHSAEEVKEEILK